jgi:hypothetical protein
MTDYRIWLAAGVLAVVVVAGVTVVRRQAAAPVETVWAWDASRAHVEADSAALISDWLSYAVVSPNMATGKWAVATAEALSGDPAYHVRMTAGGTLDARIRIPLGTRPDPSPDGHLTIRDVGRRREHDLWQVRTDAAGRIVSCTSGASFPLGAWTENPRPVWSADAASFPLRRGLITPEDVVAGVIDHPLVFGEPQIGSGRPRYPATHNTPTGPAGHLVEGTWLRLDPSVDVNALDLPTWQKLIARAAQRFGMFLRDNSGSLAVYAENTINRGGAAVWTDIGIDGVSARFSRNFPWNRMQVLSPPLG